jgi:signal transduction histidine kinase
MKRFFEFLMPERTHLKAVIAALIAIFVLTAVLGVQVHQSEKNRAELEKAHVLSYQRVAVESLRQHYDQAMWATLRGTFVGAINAADAGGSPEEVAKGVVLHHLCNGCAGTDAIRDIAFVDLKGSGDSSIPLALRNFLATADTPHVAPYDSNWALGVRAVEYAGRSRVYAFLRNRTPVTNRAWVFEIPNARDYLASTTNYIARLDYVSPEYVQKIPLRRVFGVEAHSPAFGELTRTTKARYATALETQEVGGAFVPDLRWSAAMLPYGRHQLVPRYTNFLSPNLVIALMVLIAAAIAMAIALVRREEELHRLRSDLISGVSHELRTPLAQIRMFAETLLLGRTRTEAEKRRSLEVIDQEAKRLSHFVENMLQFAKGEGGRARLAPELTSFAVEVRRAVESFAPMCQARGVEVRTELEEGVTATVDRAALRRIMLNLMENALKYGPDEQRITVGMALFNDVVRLWVDDEGEGIPRADRERVFDSFFRLNRELDRRITGSGIGLAVVRQLATLHGGRAWADEAPGGGARLVVEFPDAYVRPQEEGTGWAVA